jgi:hypothetical protein
MVIGQEIPYTRSRIILIAESALRAHDGRFYFLPPPHRGKARGGLIALHRVAAGIDDEMRYVDARGTMSGVTRLRLGRTRSGSCPGSAALAVDVHSIEERHLAREARLATLTEQAKSRESTSQSVINFSSNVPPLLPMQVPQVTRE